MEIKTELVREEIIFWTLIICFISVVNKLYSIDKEVNFIDEKLNHARDEIFSLRNLLDKTRKDLSSHKYILDETYSPLILTIENLSRGRPPLLKNEMYIVNKVRDLKLISDANGGYYTASSDGTSQIQKLSDHAFTNNKTLENNANIINSEFFYNLEKFSLSFHSMIKFKMENFNSNIQHIELQGRYGEVDFSNISKLTNLKTLILQKTGPERRTIDVKIESKFKLLGIDKLFNFLDSEENSIEKIKFTNWCEEIEEILIRCRCNDRYREKIEVIVDF